MIFGQVPSGSAVGAILAHGLKAGARSFKKGRILTTADVRDLLDNGVAWVVAARPEPGDVGEDEAARRLADVAAGTGVSAGEAFTGRANLFADTRGVARIDRRAVDRVNMVDEAVTVATVAPYQVVEARQMVATIKIIPFAVPSRVVGGCAALAAAGGGLIHLVPLAERTVGLIQTTLPGTKDSVLEKTAAVMRARLEGLGSRLAGEARCVHDPEALAGALKSLRAQGCDPLLVVGASAITDRRDVIPVAIEAVGGRVEHFGMPVDPGNLLLLGRGADGVPVVGLPGCARSPKFNGVDWVLQRLLAGIEVTGRDIMAMGAGGLLKELSGPPRPRTAVDGDLEAAPRAPRIAVLILAAGRSMRMAGVNKLLAEVEGKPMVARVADAVLESGARPVIAVVGHQAARIRAALAGRELLVVENPDFAAGLSASLKRGLAALPADVDGALVCLGDMPWVTAAQINRLVAAFNPVEGRAICVPTHKGKRGNPVLWASRFFPEMMEVSGDVGARHLIGAYAELACDVEMTADDVLVDIDTPEALKETARRPVAVSTSF